MLYFYGLPDVTIEVVIFKVKLQKINRHSPEVEIKGNTEILFGLKEKRRGLEGGETL